MFALLVALTMYLTFTPARPGLSVAEFRPPKRSTLPLAAVIPKPAVLPPAKKDPNRLGIETSSRAVMVADWKTGASLFEKNADAPQSIASVTKLMTALVFLDHDPDWQAVVEITGRDQRPGGVPYLIPGEQVTVRDLFNVSLVPSANEATVALARSTGFTDEEFVAKMNETAASLGMTGATFVDPTGLDSKNQATARDVAILVRKALERPEISEVVTKREYRFTAKTGLPHVVRSTDELLGSFLDAPPYHFLGGKTGFIEEAGYCFGAAAEDADKNGVIAVVLGAPTKELRFKEVKSLMYWAFDSYSWPKALSAR
ncbi:MAG: D-alanyl-D-alanine endopeptidase precursor [Candidatus Parcubacteria bacterium]|jgi:D-alanyl-D-alanine carboxypeptidase